MSRYLNLKQIVCQTREAELEIDGSEDRFKKLYDHDNEHLREVLEAVNFSVELLKQDGEYHIPQEDGEFIQWILEHYTDADMKLIRKGEFVKADLGFLFTLINGLDNVMKHLEIDEEIRGLQIEYMHKKTDYHIQVRIWNTQVELYNMFNDVTQYMKHPMFNLTHENRIEYLDEVSELTKAYAQSVRQAFTDIWKKRQAYVEANAMPITLEEMDFSERAKAIGKELASNEEFVNLQNQLNELKKEKGFLTKRNKEKRKIEERLETIFHETAQKYPIDVEKLTKIERIMCLADSGFQVHYDTDKQQGYITFDVDYSNMDQIASFIWGIN